MELKNIEKLEHSIVKLTISISAEELEKGKETAYKRNRSKFAIPGFRKGKAPRKIIEKLYGDTFFMEDALNIVYPDAYDKAVEESKVVPVGRADVTNVEPQEDGTMTLVIEVPVEPEVTVSNYMGIEVEKVDVTVTDEEIAEDIKRQAQRVATNEVVNRPAELGDTVTIDFEGFVDGVAFEGGKGNDFDLKLGSGTFIPGFEDQLVGKSAGDDVTVNVTFPENYGAEDLAGKAAEFKCTVKVVMVEVVPEMDDELAKDISEFETIDELKADVAKKLAESKQNAADRTVENKILDTVLANMEADVPAAMYEGQIDSQLQEFDYNLKAQGMSLESYMQATGADEQTFRGMFREQAERNVKVRLALQKIAALENIEVSAEDIDAEYNKMSEDYGMPTEEIRKFVPEQTLTADLAVQKALQLVKDNAVVTEKAE